MDIFLQLCLRISIALLLRHHRACDDIGRGPVRGVLCAHLSRENWSTSFRYRSETRQRRFFPLQPSASWNTNLRIIFALSCNEPPIPPMKTYVPQPLAFLRPGLHRCCFPRFLHLNYFVIIAHLHALANPVRSTVVWGRGGLMASLLRSHGYTCPPTPPSVQTESHSLHLQNSPLTQPLSS
mmetsp:Transcript_14978/g.30440  ORF Transcript_14978/g.30440 Transcript_14978/m.30440 type:complete len:181 (-) Transcript_14978:52-594(-)